MSMRFLPTLVALIMGVTFAPTLNAEIKVEPDKENVVASKLEGDWRLEPALTKHLAKSTEGSEGGEAISFKSDSSVAAKIPPAKYEKFLANKRVYMAGIVTFKKGGKPRENVFILIEHKGNPHVVWFRERGGDPLGNAESFNVMLAVAVESENDLLFIGGDFNNQPFSAYQRVKTDKKP